MPSDFNNPDEPPSKLKLEKQFNEVALSTGCLLEDSNVQGNSNKLNLHTSENFDEHLSSNCTEFDDNNSGNFIFLAQILVRTNTGPIWLLFLP